MMAVLRSFSDPSGGGLPRRTAEPDALGEASFVNQGALPSGIPRQQRVLLIASCAQQKFITLSMTKAELPTGLARLFAEEVYFKARPLSLAQWLPQEQVWLEPALESAQANWV